MQSAPCIKTSISIFVLLHIFLISSNESSLASTHLLKPSFSISFTPSILYTVICVLLCTSKSGNNFIISLANPKSCTIIASIPHSYAYLTNSIACKNSLSFIKIFNVKLVFTFLNLAYSIALFNSSLLKFLLFILALNSFAPKYTAFAPFCTAATNESHSPTGDNNSTFLIILLLIN